MRRVECAVSCVARACAELYFSWFNHIAHQNRNTVHHSRSGRSGAPSLAPASGQQYTRQPGIADGSVSIDWHAFIGSKRAESAPA